MAGRLGAGRLRSRAGPGGQALSPDRAARTAAGEGVGSQHRCEPARAPQAAVHVQDDRPARGHRPPYRCRTDLGGQLLRIHRLVAVAIDIPPQAAAVRAQGARGTRLDARPVLLERPRPVPNRALEHSRRGGGARGGRGGLMIDALRRHWPEYLMEAALLAAFMISASVFASLLEFPGSPVHLAIPNGMLRRALMGLAMGRSEEHTSELQSRLHLVCRLLLEKKKKRQIVK